MKAIRDKTNEEHTIAPETSKKFPAPWSGDGAGARVDTSWAITADKNAMTATRIKTAFKFAIEMCFLTQKCLIKKEKKAKN